MEEFLEIVFYLCIALICYGLALLIDIIQGKPLGEDWKKMMSKIKIHFVYFIKF